MRNARDRVICVSLVALCLTGCAASTPGETPMPPDASRKPDPRSRSLDLIVPESTADLSKLDDAALAAAIKAMNEKVNQLTSQALHHALDAQGNDLTHDATYRRLLLEMRTAEKELDRLETERDRRSTK